MEFSISKFLLFFGGGVLMGVFPALILSAVKQSYRMVKGDFNI